MRHHIFILLGLAAAAAGTALAQAVDTTADAVYGQRGNFNNSTMVAADLLRVPQAVAFDSNSNLYVADYSNHRVLFYLAGSTTPTRVYGQGGSFTTGTANKGGISADSLHSPTGLALDRDGNLYVADFFNYRVLMYAPGSTTATRVYGQYGSFNSVITGILDANSLARPDSLAFDSAGKLYVSDSLANRVLAYPPGSTTANAVWGQPGFTTANSATSATGFNSPRGIALDGANNLYVADNNNRRVLFFPSGSTTATRVYGPADTSSLPPTSTMNSPYGIALDSSGNLFIADQDNHRILFYPAGSTTPSVVYGQGGSFTTRTASVSATGLNSPRGLAIRSDGTLFVADSLNLRVVGYPPASTTATVVYGQAGDLNAGSIRPDGFANNLSPRGVAVDRSSNLYAADSGNNRILYYPAGSTTATRVYGQGGSFTTNAAATTAGGLNRPWGLTVDNSGNLYVGDNLNNRVLFYPAGSTTATRVYGQGGDFTASTINNGGLSANSLSRPAGVAVDSAGNVYIADQLNHRVLYYPAGSTTATRVYGQGGSFTTGTANNGGRSADSLNRPSAVALDSEGNLYVGDNLNARVLYFPAGSTTATRVYGQSGFTTATTGTTSTALGSVGTNTGLGVSLDNAGNLYISDIGNNRVLYYPAGSTTATQVYGQVDFTSKIDYEINPTANTLSAPNGVALDASGNLFVADGGARRVLKFNSAAGQPLTVNTSPAGRSFSVNGTPYTTAQTLTLPAGASHTVATTSPQPGATGTQYVFANWSNGGAISQSVTLSAPTTLTATFTTQHLLTTAASGPGSVTPATGFQNAGLVNVTATPTACGVFAGWSGTTVTSGQVTLTAPATLTGVFTPFSGVPVKGSIQTVRGTPIRYRQAVSVQNTTTSAADVSIILDTFGSGVTVLAPASATGTTTACTGVAGRTFYTVTGVAPGAFGTVTFDFAAPSGAGVIYNASGIVGAGPR